MSQYTRVDVYDGEQWVSSTNMFYVPRVGETLMLKRNAVVIGMFEVKGVRYFHDDACEAGPSNPAVALYCSQPVRPK